MTNKKARRCIHIYASWLLEERKAKFQEAIRGTKGMTWKESISLQASRGKQGNIQPIYTVPHHFSLPPKLVHLGFTSCKEKLWV